MSTVKKPKSAPDFIDLENVTVKDLVCYIKWHTWLYYNKQPAISDAIFDQAWDRLKEISPNHKLLRTIGQDSWDGFPKKNHWMFMCSQDKARDEKEYRKWHAKFRGNTFLVQHKLDGLSIELCYKRGKFKYGITRGNGAKGDNITGNIKMMEGVPKQIDKNFTGSVRGEIMMKKSIFQQKYEGKGYKNCRNMANGIAKQKEGKGCSDLFIMAYDALHKEEDEYFENERTKVVWLNKWFPFSVVLRECKTASDVITVWQETQESRPFLDYDIDGLVVKCLDIDLEDMKRAKPERQVAFKFPPEEKCSIVEEIIWSISGATYTPVAFIKPLELAGTTVRKASLCNPNILRDLGVKEGSRVVVVKRGDIIPKIEKVIETPEDAKDVWIPEVCEVCESELALQNEGTRLFCPNNGCPKRLHHRVCKWIEKLEIRDFGDKMIHKLYKKKMVQSLADLYTLEAKDVAILKTEGRKIGLKNAQKALNNLHARKNLPLALFIGGLDIEGIGETVAQTIVDAGYDTLDKFQKATIPRLSQIRGIGEITARALLEGLQDLKDEIIQVLRHVQIQAPVKVLAPTLAGKSFCFTGALQKMKRADAERMVKEKGGKALKGISKNLSYLVTNDTTSGTSKNVKAQNLGIPIITEVQFLSIVNGNPI